MTHGGDGGSGRTLPLRRIDVTADRLQLIGAAFPDTRVRAAPAAAGTAVQLDGNALAGALLLPDAKGAAIAGRLQRLYWRSAKAAAAGVGTVGAANATAAPPADDIDPAAIPPLNLDIDDLRFGDAQVWAARQLRTRPIAAGMRIEQLQTRAPKQKHRRQRRLARPRRRRAHAAWTSIIASEDLGALLTGFGFGSRIDGGKGEAKFKAGWPGSPATFKRRRAGRHAVDRSPRTVACCEVEPGAGRVLGLLSIAEIAAPPDARLPRFLLEGLRLQPHRGQRALRRGARRAATTW